MRRQQRAPRRASIMAGALGALFLLGMMANGASASQVGTVTVTASPATAGATATYQVSFTVTSALTGGSGKIIVDATGAPSTGTVFPAGASSYVITDLTRSTGSGTVTAVPVRDATTAKVTITVPKKLFAGDSIRLAITGVANAGTPTNSQRLAVSTSADTTPVTSAAFALTPAGDGTGTMSVAPNSVLADSPTTLAFTYTAATGGMLGGRITVAVPSGWSAPSTTAGAAGYSTASTGTVAVTGQTIDVTGVTLASGGSMTITYGAGGGAAAAMAPVTAASHSFTTAQRSSSTGIMGNLLSSPTVATTYGPNGSGTMAVAPTSVGAGAPTTLTFTYTAGAGGMGGGSVAVTVPDDWTAPSVVAGTAGYTTASAGSVSVSGRIITVSGVTLRAGNSLTITYGAGGGAASVSGSRLGAASFAARQAATATGTLTALGASPMVTVDQATLLLDPGAVTTVAGNGTDATVNGTGAQASFKAMSGTAVVGGYAYVGTVGSVRKVDLATGAATILAGDATANGYVDSAIASAVRFTTIMDVATDGTNLYVIDDYSVRRVVIATGATSTVASWNFWGAPQSLTMGPDGNLYVSRQGNYQYGYLTRVDPATGATADVVGLVSSNGAGGGTVTADGSAVWWVYMDNGSWRLDKYVPATGARTALSTAFGTGALASAGDYLYSGTASGVRRITKATGAWTDIAGTNAAGYADGTHTDAWFSSVNGVAANGTSLYVADSGNRRLRRVVPTSPLPTAQQASATTTVAMTDAAVTTVAGSGTDATVDGTGAGASFKAMAGPVVVGGYAYVATAGSIRKVDLATRAVTTLAGHATSTGSVDSANPALARFGNVLGMTTDGVYLYVVDDYRVRRVSIATGATSTVVTWDFWGAPQAITFGPDGKLYVSRQGNYNYGYLTRLDPATGAASDVVTLASSNGAGGGPITADGTTVWWVYQDNGTWRLDKYVPATGGRTQLATGFGTSALVSAGSYLYSATPTAVRRITKADGSWTQVAGTNAGGHADGTGAGGWFNGITGVGTDGANLYVADSANRRLRKLAPVTPLPSAQQPSATTTQLVDPGTVTTLAGSGVDATLDATGSSAGFKAMGGSVVVGGYAYVGTVGSIRKVDVATGAVTTLAGHPTATGTSDSTDPTLARFGTVKDLTTDGTYLYAADNYAIRRVAIATGATSTVIGWDFWGAPQGVTFGPDGNLYVSRAGSYNYGYLTRLDPKTGVASDLVTLASSNGANGGPLTSDATALWWAYQDNGSWRLEKYVLATGARTTLTTTVGTAGLVSAGNYLYSATATNVLRIAKTDGAIGYVAGTNTAGYADGTSTEAWFSGLNGLATDGAALYAVDSGNRRLRRMVDGDPLSRVADSTTGTTLAEEPYGVATVAGDGVSGTADGSGYGARFTYMGGAAYVGGYVYVGSAGAVRKIDAATGQVFTLAGSATDATTCVDSQTGSSARFQSIDDITSDGRYLYVTGVCGSGSGTYYPIRRISIATGAVSSLGGSYYHSYHLTYAPDGYLYYDVTDSNTIYRVDLLSGSATAFASITRAGWPYVYGGDLVADATDIYVGFKFNDGGFWGGTDSYATYKVPLAGGGTSTMLGTFGMRNFAVAGQALYGSDAIGHTLIKADKTTGVTTTIAGWGNPGWSDGYGPEVAFNDIRGVASDGKWLWIADASNYRVRVAAMSGSLMTGGDSFGIDGYAGIDDDVNPATGNYVRADEDVRIATPGPELAVERTYNSLDTRNGPFGVGWMFGYGMRADRMAGGSVAIIHPDGRREIHKRQPIGTYLPPPGYFSTLTDTASGGFELAEKDGTTHTFSSSGALIETADDNGRHLSLTYDGSGQLSRVADVTSGRGLTFGWTGSHITAVSTDAVAAHGGALTWRYAYDGNRLTKVCDPRNNDPATGSCVTYTWTGNRITKTTRPKGNTDTQVSYRADGRVDWKKDGIGNATTYAYPAVRRTEVTDARTNKVVKEYDGSNRLVKETDALSKVTTFEYDAYGNRSRVVDANNNSTSMTYDATGNLQSLTNGEGKTSYMAYDDGGNKILAADQRSSGPTDITYATQFEYDAAGNVTKETSPATADFPAGTVRRWTYTNGTEPAIGGGTMPAKLLRTEIDQRQKVTTRSYDSRGDLREVIDPVGQRTTYTYDELGRKTSETVYSDTHPAGVTTAFTYTKLSQEEQTTGPVTTPAAGGSAHQRRTTKVYDANGNIIELHDEDLVGGDQARVSIYTYDDDDREKSVTDPEGGVQSRTFDPVGNVATVTDAENRVTATEYDARNLPLKVTLKDFVDDPVAGSTPRDVVLAEYSYDPGRRKTSEKDALGRVVSLTYDRADHLTKTTLVGFHNRDGSTRDIVRKETVYDPAGHVTRELSGNGTRRVDHVFDAAGRRTSSTADPAGLNRTTAWVYDAAGNVLTETLSDANRTEQTRRVFDDGGRMVSETVENGATDLTTTYTYDQLDNKTSVVDARGNAAGANPDDFRTTYVYDELSQKVRTIAPAVTVEENGTSSTAQPTIESGYNAFGEVTRGRDARGATTSRTVDRLGRTVTVAHASYTAPDGTTVNPTESYVYDHVGNVTQRTDRRGATTDFTFDKRNRVVREIDPLVAGESARGTTRHTYDDAGNRLSTVDEIGARVERTYDDLNRMRTETNVVRQTGGDARYTSTFDYDDLDDPTYLQNPAGDTTTQAWSPVGELRSVTDPTSKTTTHDYDVGGRRVRSTDPLSRASTVAFDQAGRVSAASRVAPNGTVLTTTSFGYDEVGNRTSVTSARGYTTTYAYDRLGRSTGTTQPVDAGHSITTSYGYDAAGNRTRTTDGNGHTTWQTYNSWNLAEDTVEPATAAHPTLADRRWRTKYDAAGEPVHDELPGGVVVDRTFDALGRLRTESGSGGGASSATRTLGWDLSGRQTSVSHPDGQAVFSYDDRDLLVQATSPTDSSSFAYDAAGRMTSRSDAAGAAAFTWTARSELHTATDPITGATRTYTWDPAGELESVSYGSANRTYGYDDLGRLTSDELKKADGTSTEREVYGYDADDNMTSQLVELAGNSVAGQSTYGYDRAGRLVSWTKPDLSTVAYGWDDAGNRTSAGAQTYTYDERNRLTSGPDGAYTWAARGTLQSVAGASTTTYGFDALGRLVDYNGGASYSYDGLGRVVHRNGDVFTYAGTEMDPTGDGSSLYSRSPGGDLLALSSGPVSAIVGRNRHGDVTHLFNAAGTVESTRTFDPFGDVLAATGYAPQVGYQGDWTDPASGKVWMGARWYDAQDASFASRDTVGGDLTNPVSLNRYTYAFGDPMDFFDPDGHWGIRLGGLRKLFGGFGVGRSVSTSSSSLSPAVQAMVKTASQLALESGGVQVQRGNERPKMLGTSNVPAPANWSSMSGQEKYHYLREHDPSIRKIKLANPMSAKGLLTDAGKGFVTGGAAITDAGVSMVTLGHGPQIGPIFPEARFQLAYKVARPVASVGFSIGVAGGLSSAANGVRGSMLLRGSLKVGAEFAGGALGAKGADSKASARTMVKDGLISVASFGVGRAAGKVFKEAKVAMAARRLNRLETAAAAQRAPLTELANSFPRPPGPEDPRVVAVLNTPSGSSYAGRSRFPGQPHPDVQAALDSIPLEGQSDFHGRCAEIHCLTQALEAGDDVTGGTIEAVRVRGPNSELHGTIIAPCDSCQAVLDKFGVHS